MNLDHSRSQVKNEKTKCKISQQDAQVVYQYYCLELEAKADSDSPTVCERPLVILVFCLLAIICHKTCVLRGCVCIKVVHSGWVVR